ncbi:16318_t:CDS:1, partial [Funneliformis caledonium]
DDKSKSNETKETLEIKLEPQITKETRVIEPQIAEETREINLEPQIVREGIKSETQITKDTQEIISVSQIIKGSQEVKLESQMTKSSMTEVNEKVEEASIDSKIISNQHIELITKWIDHVDTANIYVSLVTAIFYGSKPTKSFEVELLHRGSRDGFTPKVFHEICDNHACTVLVIKVKDSDEILGGYNPVEWNFDHSFCVTDEKFGANEDSFIFSFKDNMDIDNHILSRVVNKEYVLNDITCGPSFSSDLITYGGVRGYCKKNSYEKIIRDTEDFFFIEDYEVFQITPI